MWGGMEVLSPPSYLSKASGLIEEESRNKRWTQAENKMFENALALYDKDTPDRWQRVAGMIPGKTIGDVIRQYKELEDDVSIIEAGLVPIPPGYNSNDTDYDNYNNIFTPATTAATLPFTLEWVNGYGNYGFDELDCNKQNYYYYYYSDGKRGFGGNARPCEQERKKGVPWTEQEHKLFLMGLKKYGKGDWRNISRNFVVTRTPTQVASHAQKYFIRQLSGGGKDKRRASIHDITTVNLDMDLLVGSQAPPPDHVDTSNSSSSPPPTLHQEQEQSATILQQQHPNYYPTTLRTNKTTAASFQHCRDRQRQDNYGGAIAPSIGFNPNHPAGNTLFVPPPLPTLSYGFDPHANGRKSQLGLQNLQQRYRVDGSQTVGFQNQQQHYPYG